MCIRDRGVALGYALLAYESLATGLGKLELNQQAIAADLDAVSYTHLRAHETVLDLVCRLLLEKKNKSQTYLMS